MSPTVTTKKRARQPTAAAAANNATTARRKKPATSANTSTVAASIAEIQRLQAVVLQPPRTNVNQLVTLIKYIDNGDAQVAVAAAAACCHLFQHLHDTGAFTAQDSSAAAAAAQYTAWLQKQLAKCYQRIAAHLLTYQGNAEAQKYGVEYCIQLLQLGNSSSFTQRLQHLMLQLLLNSHGQDTTIAAFAQGVAQYSDVQMQCLQLLQNWIKLDAAGLSDAASAFQLDVAAAGSSANHHTLQLLLALSQTAEQKPALRNKNPVRPEKIATVLGGCWSEFLCGGSTNALVQHSSVTYLTTLQHITSTIIPALSNPLLLADFLTDSYNSVDVTSRVLALNGLFVLMQRHNLDYPNFYPMLYQLCDNFAVISYSRYRVQFYQLLGKFLLSSSYLPTYLVASFAKRLARQALVAPPAGCTWIFAMIFNLSKKHPTVRYLLEGRPVDRASGADIHELLLSHHTAVEQKRLYEVEYKTKQAPHANGTEQPAGEAADSGGEDFEITAKRHPSNQSVRTERAQRSLPSVDLDAILARATAGASASTAHSDTQQTTKLVSVTATSGGSRAQPDAASASAAGVDPFLADEQDPAKTNAAQSSLWEVKTLQNHYIASVSTLAKMLTAVPVAKEPLDLAEYSTVTYQTLLEKESQYRANQKTVLAYDLPEALWSGSSVFADCFQW